MVNTSIFIQDRCYRHRYIRSKDTSLIVERPERLVAVKVGLAAAVARIQEAMAEQAKDPNDLAAALDKLSIDPKSNNTLSSISVIHSSATVDLLTHPAVQFAHAFPDPTNTKDPNEYLKNLKKWAEESVQKISNAESEIPQGLAQGDLYLCPESMDAIEGALGTVCECVDAVVGSSTSRRAFVAIRPPGHHCGEDTPSGFCFVNNAIVGAAHAHLKHGVRRVVIFDIDLHHGNGTQSLAWAINEETERQRLEAEAKAEAADGSDTSSGPVRPGLQIYYSSIHDILSYPCEDGTPALVQAASVSIAGAHGQWIENVHLQSYVEGSFWDLYEREYKGIIRKAEEFVKATAGSSEDEDVLVFISCGLDASEHEYPSMSRHGRKVPTTFYAQFTKDACAFAENYAKGRAISVLEGGYSDRALTSGTLAHFCALGLTGDERTWDETWWNEANLHKLENATSAKMKKRGRASGGVSTPIITSEPEPEPWLDKALSHFQSLEPVPFKNTRRGKAAVPVVSSSRTLRQRKANDVPASSASASVASQSKAKGSVAEKPSARGPKQSPHKGKAVKEEQRVVDITTEDAKDDSDSSSGSSSALSSAPESYDTQEKLPDLGALASAVDTGGSVSAPKKLPRVVLKLGPGP